MGDRKIDPKQVGTDGSPTERHPSAPDEDGAGARWDDDGGFEPDTTADEPDVPAPQGTLFLRGVLDASLPLELGTDDAPERYTVPAVFSRRVSREERELIEHTDVTESLARRGYPGVGLTVADRRLLIENTNLATLAAGLAGEVAAVLREVEQRVEAARVQRAEELQRWIVAEAARAARVKAEADHVHFE